MVRSAAAAPTSRPSPPRAAPEERTPDILVVGAGPAGLAAAIAAAEAGANVVLLDERAATGGQYTKPLGERAAGRRTGCAVSHGLAGAGSCAYVPA